MEIRATITKHELRTTIEEIQIRCTLDGELHIHLGGGGGSGGDFVCDGPNTNSVCARLTTMDGQIYNNKLRHDSNDAINTDQNIAIQALQNGLAQETIDRQAFDDAFFNYIFNDLEPALADHLSRILFLEGEVDDHENRITVVENNLPGLAYHGFERYKKIGVTDYEAWYTNAITNVVTFSNSGIGQNNLRTVPVPFPVGGTLDRIGLRITGAGSAGSVARLMVFQGPLLKPGSLVLDAGTIPISAVGFQALSINLVLQPGLYFFGLVHNSAVVPNFRAATTDCFPAILGLPSDMNGLSHPQFDTAFAFGAAPDPHPAIGAPTQSNNPVILFSYRLAA